MNGIERFIKVLASNHICTKEFSDNAPRPDALMERLRGILNESLVRELEDVMQNYSCELEDYSVAEGMKAAIKIMDGEYIVEL